MQVCECGYQSNESANSSAQKAKLIQASIGYLAIGAFCQLYILRKAEVNAWMETQNPFTCQGVT